MDVSVGLVATYAIFLCYFVDDVKACGPIEINAAVDSFNPVESPGFPVDYAPNLECTWMIDSGGDDKIVVLTVVQSSLESSTDCINDYVEVFDGRDATATSIQKWCGNTLPSTMRSQSRFMFIKFISNAAIQSSGFTMTYNTANSGRTTEPTGSSNVGTIAGGAGGFVTLIAIMIVCYCVISHRKPPPPVIARGPKGKVHSSRGLPSVSYIAQHHDHFEHHEHHDIGSGMSFSASVEITGDVGAVSDHFSGSCDDGGSVSFGDM